MFRLALAVSAVSLFAACGPTSPGSGSGTLFVYARFSTDGSTTSSNARIQVREAAASGAVVSNAQVSVLGGKLPRTSIPFVEQSMEYRAEGFGWDDVLKLEIVRGEDRLEASVEAPGNTVITAPTNEATVARSGGLNITWRDDDNRPAMTVRIRLGEAQVDVALAKDEFEHTVPADKLVVSDRENIVLERSNEVAPAGGVPGSAMSVTTYHSVRFRVE